MNYRERRRADGTGIMAYGCVGAAILFIFAMTFGVFEHPESPRDVAANSSASAGFATP